MSVKINSIIGQKLSREVRNEIRNAFQKLYKDLKFGRGEYVIVTPSVIRTTPYHDDFVILTIVKNGKEFFPLKVNGMESL